jgi:hypothetical protein
VLFFEFKTKQLNGWLKWTYSFILILLATITPMTVRTYYYLTLRQAYLYPVINPVTPIPNLARESVLGLDCEWYFNHPEKTIELAKKCPIKNNYIIYYYNLASAALSKLPDNLLSFYQSGYYGMFVPFTENQDYISMLFGNEGYYFIGDINASEHYTLIANTLSPRNESSRAVRRLVETNIINMEYPAAEKYIKMLKQTLFYKKWAQKMEQYLYNTELCNKTLWIVNKRAQMPVTDHIKANSNSFIDLLYSLLNDHPDNQAALDYLLCTCLLYKDLDSFYKALNTYKYQNTDTYLPELYQEALLAYFDIHKNFQDMKKSQFSGNVIQKLRMYNGKFHQCNGDGNALFNDFGKTYWFYVSFAALPK